MTAGTCTGGRTGAGASERRRCYYQGQLATGDPRVPVMIESVYGIHWQVPDLAEAIPLPGRVCPHQIYGRERFLQWSGPYVDSHATGTDAWLKGLVVYRASDELGLHSSLIASADGLRWREVEGAVWHARGADPIACAFWNPGAAEIRVKVGHSASAKSADGVRRSRPADRRGSPAGRA